MKAVAVYSTKGGVGKTTTAVNLAWEAARELRVLLWDLDPQGAATFLLKVTPKLRGGVGALVSGKTDAYTVIRPTSFDRLSMLPADDSYRELELVFDAAKKSRQRIAKVLESVATDYDVVILDCPPGASLVAENALFVADAIVVPLVPSPLSLRSLDQVSTLVAESAHPAPIVGFLSMVDRRKTDHRHAIESLPTERGEVTDVVVGSSVVLERMGTERAPVATFAPTSDAVRAYRDLWSRVRAAAKVPDAGPRKIVAASRRGKVGTKAGSKDALKSRSKAARSK